MSSSALLEATQRSVGNPMLLVNHLHLKEIRKKHKDVEKFVNDKTQLLVSHTAKYESLKEMAGTIKERKRIKNKIVTLKQKKAWMYYDDKRKELAQVKIGHGRRNHSNDM